MRRPIISWEIDNDGRRCILHTTDNGDVHIVLHLGKGLPNYHMQDIEECEGKLKTAGFESRIMVDFSNENSGKNHKKQGIVIRDIIFKKPVCPGVLPGRWNNI